MRTDDSAASTLICPVERNTPYLTYNQSRAFHAFSRYSSARHFVSELCCIGSRDTVCWILARTLSEAHGRCYYSAVCDPINANGSSQLHPRPLLAWLSVMCCMLFPLISHNNLSPITPVHAKAGLYAKHHAATDQSKTDITTSRISITTSTKSSLRGTAIF